MGIFDKDRKLGFGMMRLPQFDEETLAAVAGDEDPVVRSGIDVEQVKEMVDAFIDNGFTYFDTAWMYHRFKSHHIVKVALTDRYPHEAFTLADKMSHFYFKDGVTLDDIFNDSLKRCGVEYFDYYLLHDLGHDNYGIHEEHGSFEWLMAKKREGKVRHIGFSCHDDKHFLEKILTEHPEMEFVQIQLNYLDWDSAGIDSHGCYDMVRRFGKEIVVMEPVKGGTLVKVPEAVEDMFKGYNPDASAASWALRFAASHDGVSMVLSGMSNMEQMTDNIRSMREFKPLNSRELEIIGRALEAINEEIAIPCTSCSYCTEGCPMNIAIPKYFSLYNADVRESRPDWTPQWEYYHRLTGSYGKASDCIGCGNCERICPQHLPVIDDLKLVAERLEGHY